MISLLLAAGSFTPAPVSAQGAKIVPIDDPATAFALKLRLTEQARSSIDLVMSHLGADADVGLPLLEALRAAAFRGVKVRVIRSFYDTNYRSDTGHLAEVLLNDDRIPVRPELITFGRWLNSPVPGPHARMWTTYDEKIFVVDGRYAVLGGRGNADDYLHWRDADLYLEGPVVSGLQTVFEHCWRFAVQDFGYTRADRFSPERAERRRPPCPVSPVLAAKAEAAREAQESPGYVPSSIRIYHHDLIQTLHENPSRTFDPMPDPVLDRFVELARQSKRVLFYSLIPILDDRLKDALTELAREGKRVELITNSIQSAQRMDSNVWPYDAAVPSMRALADAGVQVRQWVPNEEFQYVHEKIAIFDDHVLFGSHNFNWSSTYSYDQADVDIGSRELADELARRFEAEAAAHAPVTPAAFLEDQERRFSVGITMSDWLMGFY